MRIFRRLLYVSAFIFFINSNGYTQMSPDADVPCQEMPHLIETYNADVRAIVRFYTGAFFGGRGGGGGNAPTEGGSPDRKERLDKLYHEYLDKLTALDFKGLSQECKVDY